MLDGLKKRMSTIGAYTGEARCNHAQKIMDASFKRDAATKPVYVKWVDRGLPEIGEDDEPVFAKFNAKSYHSITGDEIAYLLQFQNEDIKTNKNIRVGSYVSIPNEIGENDWWLIVHFDDRPLFRQFSILKCTWTYKWVSKKDGHRIIHTCLGSPRKQNSYNSGLWLDYTFQTVENQDMFWMPTNADTQTITYGTKFLKSEHGRYPPIAWKISKIIDGATEGITKFTLAQEFFDPTRDNAELMIANYYDSAVTPEDAQEPDTTRLIRIVSSTDYTIRAGGSYKKFTAKMMVNNEPVDITDPVKWEITFPEGQEEKFECIENGSSVKIKCLPYYDMVGTTFTVKASVNEDSDTIIAEVIAL